MVKYLAILLAGVLSAPAFDILVYNKTSAPVTNQALFPLRSIGAVPVYPTNYGVLMFSDAPATSNWNGVLPAVPLNWCKVSNNLVVAMTSAESNSIVSAQAAAQLLAENEAKAATKLEATNELDDVVFTVTGRQFRSLVDLIVDRFNNVHSNMVPALPPITYQQARNAVRNKILAQPDN